MCGRFFVVGESENELLARMIQEAARRQRALTGESDIAVGEVFPSAAVAAMAMGRSGDIGVFPMRWGFTRPDGKGLIINARSETALEKPLFRQSMLERRCLIPCSWYFEWETRSAQDGQTSFQVGNGAARPGASRGEKIKYAIRPVAPGIMYLAGIYRYEEGKRLPVLSVLTREAARDIAFIHNRMPVIFSEEAHSVWLDRNGDPEKALAACETHMTFRAA